MKRAKNRIEWKRVLQDDKTVPVEPVEERGESEETSIFTVSFFLSFFLSHSSVLILKSYMNMFHSNKTCKLVKIERQQVCPAV